MSSLGCPKMKIMKSPTEKATFFDLPYPIISYILSCLPTKCILLCKLVCKLWCSIIKDPQFSKSSNSITLLIRRVLNNRANKSLHFVEPEVDYTERIRNGLPCLMLGNEALIKFNDDGFDDFRVEKLSIVNSCKGLVCLELKAYGSDPGVDHYFICNPVTSDYEVVKFPMSKEHPNEYRYAGFGFCSKSCRYKVVRFFNYWKKGDGDGRCSLEVDVCTLGGDNEWRRVKNFSEQQLCSVQSCMFFDGALHWIVRSFFRIVAFNCEEENFGLMDFPKDSSQGPKTMELGILHSQLCFCVNVANHHCNIWVMTEYGVKESWRKLFVVSVGNIDTIDPLLPFKVLAYLNNGEVLMLSYTGKLVAYNVASNTWRAVKIPGVDAKIEVMLLDPVFIPTKILLMQGNQQNTSVKKCL